MSREVLAPLQTTGKKLLSNWEDKKNGFHHVALVRKSFKQNKNTGNQLKNDKDKLHLERELLLC